MTPQRENQRPPAGAVPAPGESPGGSGEGADTALEALIRRRRLQVPDNGRADPEDPQPAQPA